MYKLYLWKFIALEKFPLWLQYFLYSRWKGLYMYKWCKHSILPLAPKVEQPALHSHTYRVSRRECARFRKNIPYIKVHRSSPKHLYPKLNSYGDNGERKVRSSCGSMYCTSFACCYPYTAHARPSVSQPSQAHSAFIINRCYSYSES